MCFALEKKFELNFSAMETLCCSVMHINFTHCVVRDRFDTSPRSESASYSVDIFRELLQVVNIIVTKSFILCLECLG